MTQLGEVKVNEGKILSLWFELDEFRETTLISPNTEAPFTDRDKVGTRYTGSTSGEQVALTPNLSYALNDAEITYEYASDNPTKIAVDPYGFVVTQVPPEVTATATLTVTGTQGSSSVIRTTDITLAVSGASNVDVIEGGVVGSARKALSDVIDTAISGANPTTTKPIFTSQDHSTPDYSRNNSFFLNGTHAEAITCVSPWNSDSGNKKAGTAITKRHAILNYHYRYGVGTTVRFVASDNTVVDRTVVQAKQLFFDGQGTDAWLVLLDSDLPASITPCKLFPSDFETYLPSGAETTAAYRIPLLALDQEEKGRLLDFRYAQIQASPLGSMISTARTIRPELPDRFAFYEQSITGDSGNPVFAVIDTELWLLTTFVGGGSGAWYGGLVSELNAMIITLDTLQGDLTGYTVTEGDLSSYTTYP